MKGCLFIPNNHILGTEAIESILDEVLFRHMMKQLDFEFRFNNLHSKPLSLNLFKQELLNQQAGSIPNECSLWFFSLSPLYKLLRRYMIAGKERWQDKPKKEAIHKFICQFIYDGFAYGLYRIFLVRETINKFERSFNKESRLSVVFYNELCEQHVLEVEMLKEMKELFFRLHSDFVETHAKALKVDEHFFQLNCSFFIHNIVENDQGLQVLTDSEINFLNITNELLNKIQSLLIPVDQIPLPDECVVQENDSDLNHGACHQEKPYFANFYSKLA